MENTELKIGEYKLPEDCRAIVEKGIVKVFKKQKRVLGKEEYRCKDCKFFKEGYSTSISYKTKVCLKKSKFNPKYREYNFYYAAQKYGLPCEKFEKNEE